MSLPAFTLPPEADPDGAHSEIGGVELRLVVPDGHTLCPLAVVAVVATTVRATELKTTEGRSHLKNIII